MSKPYAILAAALAAKGGCLSTASLEAPGRRWRPSWAQPAIHGERGLNSTSFIEPRLSARRSRRSALR
jgi:hypothetical protein